MVRWNHFSSTCTTSMSSLNLIPCMFAVNCCRIDLTQSIHEPCLLVVVLQCWLEANTVLDEDTLLLKMMESGWWHSKLPGDIIVSLPEAVRNELDCLFQHLIVPLNSILLYINLVGIEQSIREDNSSTSIRMEPIVWLCSQEQANSLGAQFAPGPAKCQHTKVAPLR